MKNIILYFGSFNPIHQGHIALAEYVLTQELCDEVILIVSPQNPLKSAETQAPELARFEMAEIACKASAFPDRIKPSAVEFILPRPSYTIDTLRYLTENHGHEMHFSILMGSDLIPQLAQWKAYESILNDYPIFVYPRRGQVVDQYLDHLTLLKDAPLYDFSSTQIRETLARGGDVSNQLSAGVLRYIQEKGLWTPAAYIAGLSARLELDPTNADLYVERGKWHYRRNDWGSALNDFNHAVRLDPEHGEAHQFVDMVQEILQFRYTDLYNP
ncbi:MAG: nicotinate (nicotinamide) nucleotide adenylyltransferase [Alistipes sp.]